MLNRSVLAVMLCFGSSALALLSGQTSGSASTVSAQDRAAIVALVTEYGRALGLCEAEDYARLFAEPDGYFASGPRGQVEGHDKLVALVRSERHCNDNSERHPRNIPPSVDLQVSADRIIGRATLPNNSGHYEDVYVKTAQGWRFKSRNYLSPAEEAAKLTAQDFIDIRHLAGNDSSHFDDVWTNAPDGKRFQSAGVVIAPAAGGATGRAHLKDDAGLYQDVYVKTSQGWRFQSRTYVPAAGPGAGNH
jgi:hypothetical protein